MEEQRRKAIQHRRKQEERAREAFGPPFARVSAILFRLDPMMLNRGVNPDEYEPEVGTILPRLAGASSEAEAQEIIQEEFVAWFTPGIAGPKERYEAAAAEIWRAWLEWKESVDSTASAPAPPSSPPIAYGC